MKTSFATKGSMIGAVIAAIAASLCCVGPLVLLALGISGAWISSLTALEPIRPFAIGITLILLSITFWKLHIKPPSCEAGKPCALPGALLWQRVIFWVVTVILLGLLTFPWYAHLFY